MQTFSDIIFFFIGLMDTAIPVLTGVAVLVFFWGLAKFIFSYGNDKAVTEGKSFMVWGVVGLFILVSFVGIVKALYVGVWGTNPLIPQLPGGLPPKK